MAQDRESDAKTGAKAPKEKPATAGRKQEFDPQLEGSGTPPKSGPAAVTGYRELAEVLLRITDGTPNPENAQRLAEVLMATSHCSVTRAVDTGQLAEVLMGTSHCSVEEQRLTSPVDQLAQVLMGTSHCSVVQPETEPVHEALRRLAAALAPATGERARRGGSEAPTVAADAVRALLDDSVREAARHLGQLLLLRKRLG
jgi:hypothetical protein